MNLFLLKVSFVLVLINLCKLACSIKCYSCNGRNACLNPTKVHCNIARAKETNDYLDNFYNDVNRIRRGTRFHCFRDILELDTLETEFMGCIYNFHKGCEFQLRDEFLIGEVRKRKCFQCYFEDYCNAALTCKLNTAAFLLSLILIIFNWIYK